MPDTVYERVEELVERSPGLTEAEIAKQLFGKNGYPQRVNPDCRWLVQQNKIARRGKGGPNDPYRYYKV